MVPRHAITCNRLGNPPDPCYRFAMADDKPEESTASSPRGCLTRLLVLVLLLCAGSLGIALYFIAQPQDLSDIQTHTPDTHSMLRRDLHKTLQSSLERNRPVTITEGEINQWLLDTLVARQGGALADKVTLDGVWVRLEDGHAEGLENGRAEVVMERKLMGRPFTVSMYVQIEQSESTDGPRTEVIFHGGPFHENLPYPKCGGRFGRLPVPQGFLLLVLPAFKKLAAEFPEEIRLGFEEMKRIKIDKGRLTVDPRGPMPSGMEVN